jgi:hypothetical protein
VGFPFGTIDCPKCGTTIAYQNKGFEALQWGIDRGAVRVFPKDKWENERFASRHISVKEAGNIAAGFWLVIAVVAGIVILLSMLR